MNDMAESFIFYQSFWNALKRFPPDDMAESINAIAEYALNGKEPSNLGLLAETFFTMAKPQIDANVKRKNDGSRGGRPKTIGYEGEKPVVSDLKTSGYEGDKPNVNVNDNVKENVKEKDIKTSCSELENSTPTGNIAGSFILNDGSMYNVTENDVERFQQLYPGIDCMQELRNIAGWCESNPKNRKTRTGAKRFLNGWLSRAQNRAPTVQPKKENASQSGNRFNNFSQRKIDYESMIWGGIKGQCEKSET